MATKLSLGLIAALAIVVTPFLLSEEGKSHPGPVLLEDHSHDGVLITTGKDGQQQRTYVKLPEHGEENETEEAKAAAPAPAAPANGAVATKRTFPGVLSAAEANEISFRRTDKGEANFIMIVKTDAQTAITLNGRAATLGELKKGDRLSVVIQSEPNNQKSNTVSISATRSQDAAKP